MRALRNCCLLYRYSGIGIVTSSDTTNWALPASIIRSSGFHLYQHIVSFFASFTHVVTRIFSLCLGLKSPPQHSRPHHSPFRSNQIYHSLAALKKGEPTLFLLPSVLFLPQQIYMLNITGAALSEQKGSDVTGINLFRETLNLNTNHLFFMLMVVVQPLEVP